MEQRTDILELTSIEEADRFIQSHEKAIIFKTGTCWITDRGWEILQNVLQEYPEIPVALITVVRYRTVSNYISELCSTRHESPQVIILQGSKALYERNNMMIDEGELKKAIQENF